ncbi:MAG: hypothetical protein FVQ77_03235 [Cytophagales bacterium]|nr:hypothetical protein [Cytophagales bacterium]
MKKLLYLFSLLAIASVVVFFGCKKDEEAVPPTIGLITPGLTSNTTIDIGESIMIVAIATKGDKNLSSYTVTRSGTALSGYPKSISGGSYTDTLTDTPPSGAGDYDYTCTVTDKNDKTASTTITVVVASFGTITEKTGALYHIQGPSGCTGAYDLVAGAVVAGSGSEVDKDMKNTDGIGATFTGNWGTGTGNSTMYIKSTGTYASTSETSAIAEYSAGTPTSTITPSANDVYIAKLRGGTTYALIEITSISPTDVTCNIAATNKGKMSFKYKKN